VAGFPYFILMAHPHPPAATAKGTAPAEPASRARAGLILFAAYALLYAGFMLVNAFAPEAMGIIVFAGLNLAVVWGLGLIVAAFVLAVFYAWLCRAGPSEGRP
jgi:hypothetical protein